MRASINQTGRVVIPNECLTIELSESNKLKFSWQNLAINVDPRHEVILELSSLGSHQRFTLPISSFMESSEISVEVEKLVDTKAITGRLKIVSTDSNGLRFIVCESKTLRLLNNKLEGNQGKSLLDIYWDPHLRVPWQLTFDDMEPVLKVSNYFENAPKIYTNTVFQTAILPEVLRQIAFWFLTEDPDETQSIKVRYWWDLFIELGLSSEERNYFTSNSIQSIEMIGETLAKCQELSDRFASKHKILQKLSNYLAEEDL